MKKFLLFLFIIVILGCACIYFGYNHLISAPSDNTDNVTITIKKGSSYGTISSLLKEKNLIRNELAYKVYLKLNPVDKGLEYGDYILKQSYSVEELIEVLKKGSISLADTKTVRFAGWTTLSVEEK